MGSKCVNKDKFFKETAKRLNINEGLLDLIVYAYINNEQLQLEGHEDFPTDNYIIALLSGKNYVSEKALKKATKLWETYYSKPIITGSKERALSYRNAALKYFSHEAVIMYQGQDGTWIINVGQPQNENEKPSSFGKITKSLKEQYREQLIQFYTTQSKDAIDYSVNRMLSTVSKVKSFIGGLNKKLTYSDADIDKMNLILHTIKSNSLYRSVLKENPYIYSHKSGGKKLQVSFLNEDAIKEKARQEALKQIESFVKSLSEEQLISEIQLLNADEGIMYHLSNKQRQELQSKLPKTLLYRDTNIDSLIEELSALENTPENNLFVKTICQWAQLNRIRVPLDITQCRQLFDTAREKGWDIQLFRAPIHIQEKLIQEDTATPANSVDMANYPKCTYNTTIVTDEGSIDIYDVEDSPEGQEDICQILADASPKNPVGKPILTSPWCLSTFNYSPATKRAVPTDSARRFWGTVYTAIPKLIAIHNGFPIGFRASNHGIEWWDWTDRPSDTVNSSFIELKDKKIKTTGLKKYEISLGSNYYTFSEYGGGYTLSIFDTPFGLDIDIDTSFNLSRFLPSEYIEYYKALETLIENNSDVYIPEQYSAVKFNLELVSTRVNSLVEDAEKIGVAEYADVKLYIRNELEPKLLELLNSLPSIKSIEKELKKSPKASLSYSNIVFTHDSPQFKGIVESITKKRESLRTIVKPKQTPIDNVNKKTLNQLNTEIASTLEYAQEDDFEEISTQEEHVLDEAYYDAQDIEIPNPQEEGYAELEVPVNPMEDTPITADTVVTALHVLKDRVIAEQFNEYIEKPFMKDLEKILRGILEKYHFETIEGDLREAFGEDTLGAFDALQKIIYLANEGDRNALTYPEEFAHAFIKMMGATYRREENRERFPENKLYSELRDLLAQTDFYKEVYEQYKDVYKFDNGKPDTPRILEEAMGKALALSLVKKFEAKKDKKFFDKLKDWFNKVLQSFKKLFSTEVEEKSLEQSLLEEMDKIADSILNGSYAKKYLDKVDSTNHQLMDYADTILNQTRKDGGRALSIMQRLSSVGGIISGSLALRKQGTIYRASQDTLHDIDVMFSPDVEGSLFNVLPNINRFDTFWTPERLKNTISNLPFYQNLKQQIPGLHLITAFHTDAGVLGSAVVCDNEELVQKFANMTGNYASRLAQLTQEERDQLYIIDLMFNNSNYGSANSIHDADNDINLANYTVPFKYKLKMGRAKDLFDYLMYRPVNRNYKAVGQDVLYQKKQTKEEPVQEVTVDVTLGSTKKTYTVKGDKIYNAKGDEVFKADATNAGADRNKILANVAVKLGKAVVVDHKGRKYVVHDDNTIISGTTGKKMQWEDTNGDRIAILDSATKKKEEKKNKALVQKEKGKCLFYSGGARGADLRWGAMVEKAGYKITHYHVESYDALSADIKKYLDSIYKSVVAFLDRNELPETTYRGKLLRRDMMQAESADAIFGVAPIVWTGQKNSKGFLHKLNYPVVDGGTSYAATRGILKGLPVYIYDLKTNTWNAWSYAKNTFVVVEEPTLTPNAALIGSRSVEGAPDNHPAIQAMQSVVNKGVKSVQEKPINIQKEVKETPKVFTGNMSFAYGSGKAEGITSETTLEAIQKGERTATTRYAKDGNIDYWKNAKVGDIIEWSDKKGNVAKVRVTKPLTLLSKDTPYEEWGAKEGWSKEYFDKKVKPKIEAGEAYQIEFELIETPKVNTKTYSGKITSLKPNQIFVFGSNTLGKHGAGAAKTANDNFGAKYGLASGPQGQSYAIITKDLTKDDRKNPSRTKEQIIEEIKGLYEYAKANPDKEFLVAYSSTGKNLNHYTNEQMAEMFASLDIPSNIVFEEGFSKLVYSNPVPSNKKIKGENISSKGSPLARKLTNPGNDLTVQYKGRTFRNAEHAYLTWKSGEFDNDAYESKAYKPRGKKPVNKATNFQTMVDILTAKFKQHPDLVLEVEAAGGMEYLEKCTHDVIGDLYWEKDGNFIKALKLAYSNISKAEEDGTLKNTPLTRVVGNDNLIVASNGMVFNREQSAAIRAVVQHIKDVLSGKTNNRVITIQGKAGTGKTTIINEIIKRSNLNRGSKIGVSAVAHKAKQNLYNKIDKEVKSKHNVFAYALAGLLGKIPDPQSMNFMAGIGEVPILKMDLVIIDEASMIAEEDLDDVLNNSSGPIIFLGDRGLLPPVRKEGSPFKGKPSPIFTNNYPIVHLVERVRQGEESPVLDFADKYWDFSQGKSTIYPNESLAVSVITNEGALIITDLLSRNDDGSFILNAYNRPVRDDNRDLIIEKLIPLYLLAAETGDPYKIKIVAYRNATIDNYNIKIVNALFPEHNIENGYPENSLIIFGDSWSVRLSNGEKTTILTASENKVLSAGKPRDLDLTEMGKLGLGTVKAQDITIQVAENELVSIPVLLRTLENLKIHNENINKIISLIDKKIPVQFMGKEKILSFSDLRVYTSLTANVNYSYAITAHKSLGSTYEVVVVDALDINSVGPISNIEKAQAVYTGLTRASNITIVIGRDGNGSPIGNIQDINALIIEAKAKKKAEKPTVQESIKEVEDKLEVIDTRNAHLDSIEAQSGQEDVINEAPVLEFTPDEMEGINPSSQPIFNRDIEDAEYEDIDNTEDAYTFDPRMDEKEPTIAVESLLSEAELELQGLMANTINNEFLTQEEFKELALDVVFTVSDYINQIINDNDSPNKKGLSVKLFGVDTTGMTRRQVVKAIGINNLYEFAKKMILNPNNLKLSERAKEAIETVEDNWEAVCMLGFETLAKQEGLSARFIKANKKVEETDSLDTVDPDEIQDTSLGKKSDDYVNDEEIISDESSDNTDNDGVVDRDDAEGHVEAFGSKQDKWQVDTKTISIEQSLTQRMRNKFSQYSDLDETGNVQYNMWGIRKRVPVETACKKLSHWLNQALSFSEMKAILKKKETNNPWIALLLRDLENDVDFAGEFYVNFCKHRVNLAIITTENGRTDSLMVNSNLGRKQVMKELLAKFSLNSCTLCTANSKLDGGSVNPGTIKALEKYKKELSALSFGKKISSEDLKDNLLEASETLAAMYDEVFDIKVSAKNIYAVLTPEHIKTAISAIEALSKVKAFREKNPFESSKKPGIIYTEVSNLLLPYIEVVEETINDSVHDNGKTYQSKVIPSWLSKLFVKFTKDRDTFLDTIKKEYGPSEFFVQKDKIKNDNSYKEASSWRIPYIVRILQDLHSREVLKHVTVLHADNARYYKGMNEHQYFISTVVQFLTGYSSGTGWFRVPLQSNKPSNEFIQMTLNNSPTYQEDLAKELYYVFGQELSRIQTVTFRAKAVENGELPKSSLISNWDERGKSFCFLPCFNKYLNDKDYASTTLGKLIKAKINGEKLGELQEKALLKFALKEITDYINSRANACIEQWENQGLTKVIEARLKHKFIKDKNGKTEEVKTMLRKFVWNDTYAAINILELTVGDIAFYGNTADLQKRLAQLHAPGVRGNTEIKDYDRNSVCDGKMRHITLADESINSMIVENLKVVFSKRAAQIENKEEKKRFELVVETILDTYRGITATDGQALSCPTSYRKKGFIFGKWSKTKEEAYKNLLNGKYTYADLESLFPPTKPFVYGHSFKSTKVNNAPISQVKVNTQLKNSEYLLVLAEALMSNLDENKPNLLRAIYNVMEESAKKDRTKGIDTVVFVSNVKTGISEVIDINNAKTTEEAEEILRKAIYNEDGSYTEAVVELDAEDYSIQQDLPDHYRNHDLAMGSQFRYGVIADIAYAIDGNEKIGYNIEGRGEVSPEEFKQHFEEVISENIEEDLNKVAKSLGVSKGSIVELNVAISRLLQLEILDNPRYGLDLFWACGINKDTGNFNVPLADPTHKKRVQQLLNSILRNRINKQTMPGGPVVQVANYGTSKKLAIRFKDRKGNILPTKEEYLAKNMLDKTGQTYQEYMQENQYAPAYYECMVPVPGPIYRFFVDPKTGLLNTARVEKYCPQLLDVISYRIPTEDKYSMIPGKVVGIVPAVAGEVIIYPDDLVNISGIDFDSDKLYTMHKHFKCKRKYKTLKDLKAMMLVAYGDYKKLEAAKKGKEWTNKDLKKLEEKVDRFVRNPEDITWRDSSIFDIYLDTCLDFIVPSLENENSRLARDNRLFDMSYEVLTHPEVAHLLLNPGSFESQKKQGYLTAAFKLKAQEIPLGANRRQALKLLWEELSAMKTKDLKTILDTANDNLIFIDTLIQYYKLNAAAGTVLGIFAVAKTAHCVFEGQGISLVIDDMPETKFLGITYGGKDHSEIIVDPTTNSNGEYIGKVLGSLVSSSADAVKDPVLNLMNINQVTANVLIGMIRVGIPFEHAAMLLSQDIILKVLDKYNKAGLEGYSTLQSAIAEVHNEIAKGISSDSSIYSEDLTMEELIEGLTPESSEKIKIKALSVFTAMYNLGMKVSSFSTPTRLNSIKDSVGPFVVDNHIKKVKLGDFPKAKKGGKDYTLSDVFKDHPILSAFFETVKLSDHLLRLMPESTNTFKSAFARLTLACPKVKFTDKTMFNKFVEFYQSYLLVHNGVIDPEEAQELLNTIPKNYRTIKKEYAGNALIDALTLDIDKKGNSTVRLNLSGLSEAEKSKLKAAWTSLHRENPELSRNLFLYNFIRGGIGFNPKTFMAAFPDALKVEIKGYRECFEKEPSFTPKQEAIMIDLFVRNNTKESKLWTTLKVDEKLYTSYGYANQGDKSEFLTSTFNGPAYVKVHSWEDKKLVLRLYRKVPARVSSYDPDLGEHYKEITALGGNGQFLEISSNNVRKSISNEAVSLDETPEMVNDEPITTSTQEERISSEKVAALVGDANDDKDARVNHMMNLIENNLKKKNVEVNPELNAEIKKENNKRC